MFFPKAFFNSMNTSHTLGLSQYSYYIRVQFSSDLHYINLSSTSVIQTFVPFIRNSYYSTLFGYRVVPKLCMFILFKPHFLAQQNDVESVLSSIDCGVFSSNMQVGDRVDICFREQNEIYYS